MKTRKIKTYLVPSCLFTSILILSICSTLVSSCSVSQTVKKTTKTIKRSTQSITRQIDLLDEDLKRMIGMLNFENKSLRQSRNFQEIFHKDLSEYMNNKCRSIIVAHSDTFGSLDSVKETPKLKSGATDIYALAVTGRQMGLNSIVTISLEDIRFTDELRGILWTKDTHYFVDVFIRAEVFDTGTATKILDETFDHRIEFDDNEYRLIRESETLEFPELNETLNRMRTDIGDSICDAVTNQPWNGYITKIDGEKYFISSGSRVGLLPGNILEVYDNGKVIEGVGGQRFSIPGQKTGEIEIVNTTEDKSEAILVAGNGIRMGSMVRRK